MSEQRLKAYRCQVLCVLNHRFRKSQNNSGGKGCPEAPSTLISCSEQVKSDYLSQGCVTSDLQGWRFPRLPGPCSSTGQPWWQ